MTRDDTRAGPGGAHCCWSVRISISIRESMRALPSDRSSPPYVLEAKVLYVEEHAPAQETAMSSHSTTRPPRRAQKCRVAPSHRGRRSTRWR